MPNIEPSAGEWADIPQIEWGAPATAGEGGTMNAQAVPIAQRTMYLRDAVETISGSQASIDTRVTAVESSIDGVIAGQSSSAIYAGTIEELQGKPGEFDGQGGIVANGDGAGTYRWGADASAWVFLRGDALSTKADKSELATKADASVLRKLKTSTLMFANLDITYAVNASGRRVIISEIANGVATSYEKVNGVEVLDTLTIPSGILYPSRITVIKDASGRRRLLQAIDGSIPGQPVNYAGPSEGSASLFVPPSSKRAVATAGQSNIGGRGTGGPNVPAGSSITYKNGSWGNTADPVGIRSNDRGSAFPALANRYFQITGEGTAFIPTALGGTTLTAAADAGQGNWSPTGVLRSQSVSLIKAGLRALDEAHEPWTGLTIVWGLGETEANAINAGTITLEDFDMAFRDPTLGDDGKPLGLLPFYQSELGMGEDLQFVIMQLGCPYGSDPASWQAVRDLQAKWALDYRNVFIGFAGAKTFQYRDRTLSTNNGELHYNQLGYDDAGNGLAVTIAALPKTQPLASAYAA